MNYNEAELCKDCKMPVEKFNVPKPKFDYKTQRRQYVGQWRKVADMLLSRMKYKEIPRVASRHVDVYELFANGKRYLDEDPGKIVSQAMTRAGWVDLLRQGAELKRLRNMEVLNI